MKKTFTLLFISLLAFCTCLRAQDTTNFWQEIEKPSSENIHALCIDRYSNDIYIVLANGFYVTTDKGETWTFLGPMVSGVSVITDIITNELGHIYVSTASRFDNGCIFLSKDKCKTWEKLYESELHAIFIKSYPNGLLYSSCADSYSTSVLRSQDYGQTWNKVLTFQAVMEFPQDALVYNDSIVYIATNRRYDFGGGIYRSIDSGNTWSNIGLQGNDCKSIILNNDNDVVVGTVKHLSDDGGGLFKLNENLKWDRLTPTYSVTNLCINNLGDIFWGHHMEEIPTGR